MNLSEVSDHDIRSSSQSTAQRENIISRCVIFLICADPRNNCITVVICDAVPKHGLEDGLSPDGPFACNAEARFRISGAAIDVEFEVISTKNPIVFANSLLDLLRTNQALNPELEPHVANGVVSSVSLYSSAPIRNSVTLSQGWRESFDFDVFFNGPANASQRNDIY